MLAPLGRRVSFSKTTIALFFCFVYAAFFSVVHAQSLPPVAENTFRDTIRECGGRLKVKQGFITQKDINGDSRLDFILDYEHVECNESLSYFCGTAGCVTQIFVSSQDGAYVEVLNRHVRGLKFSRVKGRPSMILNIHGSNCGRAGAERCELTLYWNGFTFDPAN